MNRYRSTHENSYQSHQDRILNAVVEYGYLAPRILARDEEQERMRHDCALRAELATAASAANRRPILEVARRRLGEILILIGTKLQGTPPMTGGDPIASPAA
jgi:hypothetical protein